MYVQRCPHVMESIHSFVVTYAPHFSQLGVTDEHRLEYTEIHRQYLALLDGHVQQFLQFQGAAEEDFIAALAQVQENGEQEWKPFKALLDKTDYYTFAKMMQVAANGMGVQGGPPAD